LDPAKMYTSPEHSEHVPVLGRMGHFEQDEELGKAFVTSLGE